MSFDAALVLARWKWRATSKRVIARTVLRIFAGE
jgi:hypothetical protein